MTNYLETFYYPALDCFRKVVDAMDAAEDEDDD